MSPILPRRRVVLAAPLVAALLGGALVGFGLVERAAQADAVLVASSVCEAHELKARQAEDPHLQIEIPPEFQSPWPTREACLSYAAAEDPDTPGPVQPIQFSHKHHSGLYQIDCLYCHAGAERSRAAGVPSVELCMGCHELFPASYDEFEGIRVLKDHWVRKAPIEWLQVNRLPEHVKFRHNRHLRAGVACQTCHGPVEQMDKVSLTPDTHWWPWLLPTQKLEMGWCINCHRNNGATQDCYACHH
jgi:hypothetical protein